MTPEELTTDPWAMTGMMTAPWRVTMASYVMDSIHPDSGEHELDDLEQRVRVIRAILQSPNPHDLISRLVGEFL